MGLLDGDARTLFIVDAAVFGVSSVVFLIMRRVARKSGWTKCTRNLLSRALLANVVRFVMGLLTLFSLWTTERSPGKVFIWTRWLAYAIIFGGEGVTHALLEFLHQHNHHTQWVVSASTFGLASLCAFGINFAPDKDQHIVLLSLAGIFLLSGIIALYKSAKRRDVTAAVITTLIATGHIAYGVVLVLSPLVTSLIPQLHADGAFFALDVVHIIIAMFVLYVCHCSSAAYAQECAGSAHTNEAAAPIIGEQPMYL